MSDTGEHDVTGLLRAWRNGDARALDRLMPLVYDEMRRLARRQLRHERRDVLLQTTGLVHETYRRLIGVEIPWNDRVHFLAVTARVMRRVLVEHARKHRRGKHGGGLTRITLENDLAAGDVPAIEILALHQALERLEAFDERKARSVELHYFGGLTYEEAAAAMEISPATFHREIRLARAWLERELDGGDSS